MATIKATCPGCGDVKLRARELTVRLCPETDSGTYTFACPRCRELVARDASPRVLSLLVTAGVATEVWHQPAELSEPHEGPPIAPDDLLDFHLMLQGEDWFDRLAESVGDAGA